MHSVSNPFQACNDIFFRPNGVFKAVGEKKQLELVPLSYCYDDHVSGSISIR